MKRRLLKEFRSLLLPWSIAVVAGAVLAVKLMVDPSAIEGFDLASGSWTVIDPFESILARAAAFVFFGTLVIACALSFGTELQQRTLPLLLAQPIPRATLWNEKLLVLAGAVLAAVLIHWLVQLIVLAWVPFVQPHLDLTPHQMLLAGSFLLAAVCSAGFWTLLARSTIGGMVFSLGAPGFLGLVAASIATRTNEPYVLQFGDSRTAPAIIVTWLIYSPVLLWLGWRMFARLEVRGVAFEGGGALSLSKPHLGRKWWSDWLRCRPKGGLLNLVRKELWLHKPVFQVAAIFVVCWFATFLLLLLQPARQPMFETTLNFLTGSYIPLVLLLAGCVSLGDEKTLGLTAWQLTLPISARRQWLVKLGVAAGGGVALGLVLPYLLAWLTAAKANVGLFAVISKANSDWASLLLVSALVLAMSFWAGSLVVNAVRAALVSVIGLVALLVCGRVGPWCGGNLGGLETPLLTSVVAHFQLSPYFFKDLPSRLPLASVLVYLFFVALILAALVQSLAQFRRAQTPTSVIFRYSLVLAAMTFLSAFWFADFEVSAFEQRNSRLVRELQEALHSLPAERAVLSSQKSQSLTPQELAQTGKLSKAATRWLKGTSITLKPVPKGRGKLAPLQFCLVELTFPKGIQFPLLYEVPPPAE